MKYQVTIGTSFVKTINGVFKSEIVDGLLILLDSDSVPIATFKDWTCFEVEKQS